MNHLRPAFVLIALFTALTGIALPFAFTGAAIALVPDRANGTLIVRDGHVAGSALIGQAFTADRYFHGRPSATVTTDAAGQSVASPYDASSSGGSNLGATSKALIARVSDAVAQEAKPIPADAVTSSGSGLDPDISPENADRQVVRVAAARGMGADRVRSLVAANTQGRLLGVFGQPSVNVLALNLELDRAQAH